MARGVAVQLTPVKEEFSSRVLMQRDKLLCQTVQRLIGQHDNVAAENVALFKKVETMRENLARWCAAFGALSLNCQQQSQGHAIEVQRLSRQLACVQEELAFTFRAKRQIEEDLMDREGTCQSLLVENADLKQRLLEMQAKLDDKEELQDKLHCVKVDQGLEEEELDVDTPVYAEGRVSPFCCHIPSDDSGSVSSEDVEDMLEDDDEADVCSSAQSEVTAEAAVSIQEVSPEELVVDLTMPLGRPGGYGVVVEAEWGSVQVAAKVYYTKLGQSHTVDEDILGLCHPRVTGLSDFVTGGLALCPSMVVDFSRCPSLRAEPEHRAYSLDNVREVAVVVMERAGPSLREMIDNSFYHDAQGHLKQEILMPHLQRMAECVHAVHMDGCLVCDLKPENIVATSEGYKLCDAGSIQPFNASFAVPFGWGRVTCGYYDEEYLEDPDEETFLTEAVADTFAFGQILKEILDLTATSGREMEGYQWLERIRACCQDIAPCARLSSAQLCELVK